MHTETTLSYKNRQFLLEETTANTYTAKEKKEKKHTEKIVLGKWFCADCKIWIVSITYSCSGTAVVFWNEKAKSSMVFLWFLIQVYVPVTLTLCWLIFQVKKKIILLLAILKAQLDTQIKWGLSSARLFTHAVSEAEWLMRKQFPKQYVFVVKGLWTVTTVNVL